VTSIRTTTGIQPRPAARPRPVSDHDGHPDDDRHPTTTGIPITIGTPTATGIPTMTAIATAIENAGVIGMNNNGPLATARQVAQFLNVSISWVLAHAAGRRLPILPSHKLGKAVRFHWPEVYAFVETCRRAMEQGRAIQ
jgi:hypothetical protein